MENVCIFAYQNPGATKFEVRASSTTPLSCRARAGTDIDGFFFPGGGGLCVLAKEFRPTHDRKPNQEQTDAFGASDIVVMGSHNSWRRYIVIVFCEIRSLRMCQV